MEKRALKAESRIEAMAMSQRAYDQRLREVQATVEQIRRRSESANEEVQEKTSQQALKNLVAAEVAKQLASLRDVLDRVGLLEEDTASVKSSTQLSMQQVDQRVVRLEGKIDIVPQDPRFEAQAKQLADMQEQIASRATEEALAALQSSVESDFQGVRDDDKTERLRLEGLETRMNNFDTECGGLKAAVNDGSQDIACQAALHNEFRVQLDSLNEQLQTLHFESLAIRPHWGTDTSYLSPSASVEPQQPDEPFSEDEDTIGVGAEVDHNEQTKRRRYSIESESPNPIAQPSSKRRKLDIHAGVRGRSRPTAVVAWAATPDEDTSHNEAQTLRRSGRQNKGRNGQRKWWKVGTRRIPRQ